MKSSYFLTLLLSVAFFAGCKKPIEPEEQTPEQVTLSAPELSATAVNNTAVLEWKRVDQATGYVVEMRTTGAEFSAISIVKDLAYTVEGLDYETKYDFRVRAEAGSVKGPYSSVISVTTGVAPEPEHETLFSGGRGTVDEPFIISTKEDFTKMISFVNGTSSSSDSFWSGMSFRNASYVLTDNIDFNATSVSVARDSKHVFGGTFDGGGHTVKGLTVKTSTEGGAVQPIGLFGYVGPEGVVKNVTLEGLTIKTDGLDAGGIAGLCEGVIENCSVKGEISSTANLPFTGKDGRTYSGSSVAGGIVGYLLGGKVKNCTFDGSVWAANMFAAGIAGTIWDSGEVDNCTVLGSVACQKNCSGGITAYLEDGSITGCVVAGSAIINGSSSNVGGIAAFIEPTQNSGATCTIDRCAVYGNVVGSNVIGGIAGWVKAVTSDLTVKISNCAYLDGRLESTGVNSYDYNVVGGVVAWFNNQNQPSSIVAGCYSRPKEIKAVYVNKQKGSIAGLVAHEAASKYNITGSYTDITAARMKVGGKAINETDYAYWGGVFAQAEAPATFSHVYYPEAAIQIGRAGINAAPWCSNVSAMTPAQMTDGTLLKGLQTASSEVKALGVEPLEWVSGADGYPALSGLPADPRPVSKNAVKVSILGDSISTFAGYLEGGYATYYPNGDVTNAAYTYWYKIIYNKMKDAVLEKNLSWSGTTVARCTDSSQSGQHYYGHEFSARVIERGLGDDPDVIFIHGGTNDVSGRGGELAPGYSYSSTAIPTDAEFANFFAVADAASSYAEICALEDRNFCQAYIRLLRIVKNRYPSAKVVCIIGDYLLPGYQTAITKSAEHYGYKVVDLLKENGYKGAVKITKASGCHPDINGMEFMADFIYKTVGGWIDP